MRSFAAVTACVAACCALASTASASTVFVSKSGVMRLAAGSGEVNHVTLREAGVPSGLVYTVGDTAGVHAAVGCTQVAPTQAQCLIGQASDPTLGGRAINQVVLDLGDRNDTSDVLTFGVFASVAVRGGFGDDVLTGGAEVPSTGAYEAHGGPGDDVIDEVSTNGGPVDVDGGFGDDTLSTTGTVGPGSVRGGPGADTLTISGFVSATIDGGSGPDVIKGVALNGRDPVIGPTILGGFGRDTIDGLGAASIDCGPGLDSFVVYAGQTATGCETPLP
jgi:hypothetical protein